MGGDFGPEVTVPASLRVLDAHPDLQLFLVGDGEQIDALLRASGAEHVRQRLSILHTECVVRDSDKPTSILRDKSHSSMYLAVDLVKQSQVGACVSAGNTGALLLSGRHLLKTLPGVEKPAILATIPAAFHHSYLLDVGANVDCRAEQLFEFAVMGSVLAESLDGLTRARVALLNIGVEDYKGNEQVKAAAALLENCAAINYVGFVEGSALFEGRVDVVVCDGFVGNVIIKSSAGVVQVVNHALAEIVTAGQGDQAGTEAQTSLIAQLRQRVNPSKFNGASLLGLQGSIIKSHGNAAVEGFSYAIERAIKEVENNVPGLIAAKVAQIVSA
jgi:glycerol-3-phosphate acyltransferase PlsX